jgi:hypothetical protein
MVILISINTSYRSLAALLRMFTWSHKFGLGIGLYHYRVIEDEYHQHYTLIACTLDNDFNDEALRQRKPADTTRTLRT